MVIAKGPDATKGFRVQRRRLDANVTGLEKLRDTLFMLFCGCIIPALTLPLGVLLIWLLPSLVAGGVPLCACAWLAKQLRVQQFASIVASVAIGLVLACWTLDRVYDTLLTIMYMYTLPAQQDVYTLALKS